jgi:hypothetical protein
MEGWVFVGWLDGLDGYVALFHFGHLSMMDGYLIRGKKQRWSDEQGRKRDNMHIRTKKLPTPSSKAQTKTPASCYRGFAIDHHVMHSFFLFPHKNKLQNGDGLTPDEGSGSVPEARLDFAVPLTE